MAVRIALDKRALGVDMSLKKEHTHVNKLLTAARHALNDDTATKTRRSVLFTLTQLADRIGVSLGELRDDPKKWPDTSVKLERITTRLLARLHAVSLSPDEDMRSMRNAAIRIMQLEIQTQQPSADNKVVIEGSGMKCEIINYARLGKKLEIDGGDETKVDQS